ncbi:hypothetical protein OG21DRAFT_258347 [Imleria badia]|nr:hypothetical protein OG21DRAFT_258347 [Imleria badia]
MVLVYRYLRRNSLLDLASDKCKVRLLVFLMIVIISICFLLLALQCDRTANVMWVRREMMVHHCRSEVSALTLTHVRWAVMKVVMFSASNHLPPNH